MTTNNLRYYLTAQLRIIPDLLLGKSYDSPAILLGQSITLGVPRLYFRPTVPVGAVSLNNKQGIRENKVRLKTVEHSFVHLKLQPSALELIVKRLFNASHFCGKVLAQAGLTNLFPRLWTKLAGGSCQSEISLAVRIGLRCRTQFGATASIDRYELTGTFRGTSFLRRVVPARKLVPANWADYCHFLMGTPSSRKIALSRAVMHILPAPLRQAKWFATEIAKALRASITTQCGRAFGAEGRLTTYTYLVWVSTFHAHIIPQIIEMDERYCEVAARRLSQAVLFDAPAPEPVQAGIDWSAA